MKRLRIHLNPGHKVGQGGCLHSSPHECISFPSLQTVIPLIAYPVPTYRPPNFDIRHQCRLLPYHATSYYCGACNIYAKKIGTNLGQNLQLTCVSDEQSCVIISHEVVGRIRIRRFINPLIITKKDYSR